MQSHPPNSYPFTNPPQKATKTLAASNTARLNQTLYLTLFIHGSFRSPMMACASAPLGRPAGVLQGRQHGPAGCARHTSQGETRRYAGIIVVAKWESAVYNHGECDGATCPSCLPIYAAPSHRVSSPAVPPHCSPSHVPGPHPPPTHHPPRPAHRYCTFCPPRFSIFA